VLAFPVHVANSRAQARAECEPGLLRFLRMATEAALPSVQGVDFLGLMHLRWRGICGVPGGKPPRVSLLDLSDG
jgi:hypothetical protein